MCTLVMSYDDPLGATTSSRNTLVGMDDCEASSMMDEIPEDKDGAKPDEPDFDGARKESVQLYFQEESQICPETNPEEHNQLHANNWCIAVVTIILCLLFFLYYCF